MERLLRDNAPRAARGRDDVRSRIRSQITGVPTPPRSIGRLILLETIGEGGMGTVYAAYDRELERKVAIKVVRAERADDERATTLMLREAQALAKLAHPNLVPVFEVGRVQGQIHLVMELVHGSTMREWVTDGSPPWDRVLAHWLDIAGALAAVHDAGLVHRDVKPSNVLVGGDGRARLVDFGLARASERTASLTEATLDGSPRASSSLTPPVPEQVSAVGGTPAYMAPEVFLGAIPTARADMYSLCVSIYESLFGERPPAFEQESPPDPPVREDAARVPRGVVDALRRGFSKDPQQRFEDIPALIDTLQAATRRPWRTRATWGSAVVIAAGISGLSVYALTPPSVPAPCERFADELSATWSDETRDAVQARVLASELPFAKTLAAGLANQVDDYVAAWISERRTACLATHVDHLQSSERLDRRVACLERRRTALASVVDGLRTLEPARATAAVDAVAGLPHPADCGVAALVATTYPEPSAENREAFAQLERDVAMTSTGLALAGPEGAVRRLEELRTRAEGLGHSRVVGHTCVTLGEVLVRRRDPAAMESLERAENIAEAHSDLLLKERARRSIDQFMADVSGDVDAAQAAVRRYEATIAALGSAPHHEVRVLADRGRVYLMMGEPGAAETELLRAVQLATRVGPLADRNLVNVLALLATAQSSLGKPEEAMSTFDQLRDVDARWGLDRLDRAHLRRWPGRVEHYEGYALLRRGDLDAAGTKLREALDEQTRAYGRETLLVAETHGALAALELQRGNTRQAETHARRADEITVRWLGPIHERRRAPLSAIGAVAFDQGRYGDAHEAFAQALEIVESILAPGSLDAAYAHNNVGEVLVLLDRPRQAGPHLDQALAGMRQHLAPDDVQIALPLKALALIDLEAGRTDEAAKRLEEALALHDATGASPVEHARTQWALARTRAAQDRPGQARELAAAALAAYDSLGAGAGEALIQEASEIRTFLGNHRPPDLGDPSKEDAR